MAQTQAIGRPTRTRHIVLWLTVAAYMITYMDRVVISAAVPVIQKELGFALVTMGWILSSFRWGYALFQIPGGWLGDRIGPRRALTLIVTWWSLFTYESKPDEKKHFIIRSVTQLSEKDWKGYIGQQKKNEALVFVHGFDTSF